MDKCEICGEEVYLVYWYYGGLWLCIECLEEETDG